MSSKLQLDVRYLGRSGAIWWWMLTGWGPCVAGWGGGVFASCLVRCTAPPVAFADQVPLPRLYSAPGRGFLMEVAVYQFSTLYLWPFYPPSLNAICAASLPVFAYATWRSPNRSQPNFATEQVSQICKCTSKLWGVPLKIGKLKLLILGRFPTRQN